MKLKTLLQHLDGTRLLGNDDVEIAALTSHASNVTKGALFIALRGMHHDGHDFVNEALERGAAALVVERSVEGISIPCVVVPETRSAMARIAQTFFEDPSRKLTLIGVTGTNGKTSTTHLLESIWKAAGMSVGVLGTLGYRIAGKTFPASHTTPEVIEVQRLLRQMVDAGCEACVMEVSSHALEQRRVEGLHFDGAVFTNLTPEHLDYHGDMESYYLAKTKLFFEKRFAVINSDDPFGNRLAEHFRGKLWRYGERQGDVVARDIDTRPNGTSLLLLAPQGTMTIHSPLVGRFQVSNILAATTTALALGLSREAIITGIAHLTTLPGRFEFVPNHRGILAYVDYAHTPDALQRVLLEGRRLTKGKVIVVFGCGGDRDRLKRPLMGAIAAEHADIAIVTSDNPRSEDPQTIIEEIFSGVQHALKPRVEMMIDRRAAIACAVNLAVAGDVVIVAGKGHEDYQICGTERRHFDDREEIERILGGQCNAATG